MLIWLVLLVIVGAVGAGVFMFFRRRRARRNEPDARALLAMGEGGTGDEPPAEDLATLLQQRYSGLLTDFAHPGAAAALTPSAIPKGRRFYPPHHTMKVAGITVGSILGILLLAGILASALGNGDDDTATEGADASTSGGNFDTTSPPPAGGAAALPPASVSSGTSSASSFSGGSSFASSSTSPTPSAPTPSGPTDPAPTGPGSPAMGSYQYMGGGGITATTLLFVTHTQEVDSEVEGRYSGNDECWEIDLRLNPESSRALAFCRQGNELAIEGGSFASSAFPARMPLTGTLECDPMVLVRDGMQPGDVWEQGCKTLAGPLSLIVNSREAGRTTFVGVESIFAGGKAVDAWHIKNEWTRMSSQNGTVTEDYWISTEDMLLLQYARSAQYGSGIEIDESYDVSLLSTSPS